MKGEQFITEVRKLAGFDSSQDAQNAISARLETLKERLAALPFRLR